MDREEKNQNITLEKIRKLDKHIPVAEGPLFIGKEEVPQNIIEKYFLRAWQFTPFTGLLLKERKNDKKL